jgi:hypothetical protein
MQISTQSKSGSHMTTKLEATTKRKIGERFIMTFLPGGLSRPSPCELSHFANNIDRSERLHAGANFDEQ